MPTKSVRYVSIFCLPFKSERSFTFVKVRVWSSVNTFSNVTDLLSEAKSNPDVSSVPFTEIFVMLSPEVENSALSER